MHKYLERVLETESVKDGVGEMGYFVDIHFEELVAEGDVVVVVDY